MATPPAPLHNNPLLAPRLIATMHPRQHGRHRKKHTVHNPHGKTRLEHAARLVNPKLDPPDRGAAQDAEIHIHARPDREMRAVGGRDEAQVVDACDEGADKGEVDERDELGVAGGAVVAEERGDGPGEREDRDDEEEEDVGWGHDVGGEVDVDEVGEHAHDGDLRGGAG